MQGRMKHPHHQAIRLEVLLKTLLVVVVIQGQGIESFGLGGNERQQQEEEEASALLTLPNLPYNYDALSPVFDEETMRIHHTMHHNAYTMKTNLVIEALKSSENPRLRGNVNVRELLENLDSVPESLRTMLRNNGGGYLNHIDFFIHSLTPNAQDREILPTLSRAFDKSFGGFENFKIAFHKVGMSVFGSGWVWLLTDSEGNLTIQSSPNQDRLDISNHLAVLLACDVWEHSYYLKFRSNRDAYLNAFFQVANFKAANIALEKAAPGICVV